MIARSLTVLALLAAIASAEPAQVELAEKLKQKKIDRFFKAIEANKELPADVKEKVMRLKKGALLGGEYDCIHQSLVIMNDEYKRANAMLLNDRFAGAAEILQRIAKTKDEYLAGYAKYRFGLAEINRERYEQAVVAFTDVINTYGRRIGCDVDAAFYLAVALGQSREKEKAIVASKRFLEDYPDAPERYRKATEQMLNELLQDWESPLYDLSSRMQHIGRVIEAGDTGKRPQAGQKEIVSILDELIKKAQEQEGGGNGGGGGGGGPPRGNRQSNSPASRTALPPGASRVGDLRGRNKRKPGEIWGKMGDKEREEVLQALKEKFPERFRELQKWYERALAEEKRVTEAEVEGPGAGE